MITKILSNIINRKRFIYTWKDILNAFVRCFCLRSNKTRLHMLYERAETKLNRELDVVTLVKAMRQMKLIT